MPTMFERPTTTARRPAIGIPDRLRISTAACAVVGRNPECPSTRWPALIGAMPSMSLAGSSASVTVFSGIRLGSGIWTMIPATSGSALRATIAFRRRAAEARPGISTSRPAIPTLLHVRRICWR